MALFGFSKWLALLTPEQRRARGFPPHVPDPKTGPGRKKIHTPALDDALARLVEKRKRAIDAGADRFERRREYGDACGNAKAIEVLALEEYRQRLTREGMSPDEAARRAEEYARTLVFRDHMRVLETKLSGLRRAKPA